MIRFSPGQLCAPTCCDDDCEAQAADFDNGAINWPSHFFLHSATCQLDISGFQVPTHPTIADNTCSDCSEYTLSLASSTSAKLYAVGTPVTFWRTQEQSSCTGSWLWELVPPASPGGYWYLYAGGATAPSATYRSLEPPHRYYISHPHYCEQIVSPHAGHIPFYCSSFDLVSNNTDCQDWPTEIYIHGCFCDTSEVCHICQMCSWDLTPQNDAPTDSEEECCTPRVLIDSITNYTEGDGVVTPPLSPQCGDICAYNDGTDDYLIFLQSYIYQEDNNTYPSCIWGTSAPCQGIYGSLGLGIKTYTFTRVTLTYDKDTDQYKLILAIYALGASGGGGSALYIHLGTWVKDWFARENPCWDFGTHVLTATYTNRCCLGTVNDPEICGYSGSVSQATITFDNNVPCDEWSFPE